jgi:cob(I)alamin adenosyltransferase
MECGLSYTKAMATKELRSAASGIGRILVITGSGKGKTTAALGLALRAIGHGMTVVMIQFIKLERSGEHSLPACLQPWLTIIPTGAGFVDPNRKKDLDHHRLKANQAMELVKRYMDAGTCQMLILDEIFVALQLDLVQLPDLVNLIQRKSPSLHLVLTGREAPGEILEMADTVSEIQDIKHPFSQGAPAQKGIEF